jgi:hypothetical protein
MTRAQAVSRAWVHCGAGTYLEANSLEKQARRGGCDAWGKCLHARTSLPSPSLTYDALRAQVSSTLIIYTLYALTFPTPLMTPPDTSTYFMIAFSALATVWGRERRNLKGRGASQEICR